MRFLFDVSRHLRRLIRSTPTGIDRVDAAYVRLLPHLTDSVSFVAKLPGFNRIKRVDKLLENAERRSRRGNTPRHDALHAQLLDYLSAPVWPDDRGCRRLANKRADTPSAAKAVLAGARQVFGNQELPANLRGTVYLNMSHSGLENALKIRELKHRGAGIVAMLHDLIPLDYPEFCREGEDEKHRRRMISLLRHADLIIANSAYSRDRFQAWLEAEPHHLNQQGRSPRIVVVPLAVEDAFLVPASLAPPLSSVPYFVCLGTIEARKNHALLLLLWRRLAEALGDQCPRLVLVGRRGWKIEQALDLLAHGAPLARHVVEVSDLSDRAVASVMSGAHGVVQPSLVEGFGLPILEANALGIPVIASDIPAHREVALLARNNGIRLVDPFDIPRWMSDITMLAARKIEPGTPHQVSTWSDHVQQTLEAVRGHFQQPTMTIMGSSGF